METKNWYALVNFIPPKPDDFHVMGDLRVGNPRIKAHLCVKEPHGINPKILLSDLHLIEQLGPWPEVMTCVQAMYDKILTLKSQAYEQVEVFFENDAIAEIHVNTVR